jgi:hypothetical protein
MPRISILRRRLLPTILLALLSAFVAYFARRVLGAWGVLDSYADNIGAWLHLNISRETALNFVAISIGIALYSLTLLLTVRSTRRSASTQPSKAPQGNINLVFPFEANSEGKESLFKRSWSPLPNRPILRQVSIHRFFVSVENPSSAKTLRNVRVVMESISKFPGQVLDLPCICDRTGSEVADIPPRGHDYFLIGEGADYADDGLFRPRFISNDEYNALLAKLEANSHIGFALHGPNGAQVPLLKNDGYLVEIAAYADDVPPVKAQLRIDAKHRIDLYLKVPNEDSQISIQDAAFVALETAEELRVLDRLVPTSAKASPSDKMPFFIYSFLLSGYELCGEKFPSKDMTPIPREYAKRLRAIPRQNRVLLKGDDRIIYENVKMNRSDLIEYLKGLRNGPGI